MVCKALHQGNWCASLCTKRTGVQGSAQRELVCKALHEWNGVQGSARR
jgi:hypothetical protein